MAANAEVRTFYVTCDAGDTYPFQRVPVEASYYNKPVDSSLVEFKDTDHRVVFAVAESRIVRISTRDHDDSVAAAERRLRNAEADQAEAAKRYAEAVKQAQDVLARVKANEAA